MEISPTPELNHLEERDYTLAAWSKPEAVPTSGQESYAIVANHGFHGGLFFSLNARFYIFQWFEEKGQAVYRQIDSGNTYTPGSFHHVAGVIDWTRGRPSSTWTGPSKAAWTGPGPRWPA